MSKYWQSFCLVWIIAFTLVCAIQNDCILKQFSHPPTDGSAVGTPLTQAHHSFSSPSSEARQDRLVPALAFTFDDLLDAIEYVESGGDPDAVGDDGKAVGAYQIHKIYVDDINRIFSGFVKYDYQDRYNKAKSREMVRLYTIAYLSLIDSSEFWLNPDKFKAMARIHNGGPDGWKKDSTKAYWEKVKARMKVRIVE